MPIFFRIDLDVSSDDWGMRHVLFDLTRKKNQKKRCRRRKSTIIAGGNVAIGQRTSTTSCHDVRARISMQFRMEVKGLVIICRRNLTELIESMGSHEGEGAQRRFFVAIALKLLWKCTGTAL